jgi:hypothetical protein
MKKKTLIIVSLILLLIFSASLFATDGTPKVTQKGSWTRIHVRQNNCLGYSKIMYITSEATKPVTIRWDYYVEETGKIKSVLKAPGAYPGAFYNKKYYHFYWEEFIVQKGESFFLPPSVYCLYIKLPKSRVKVAGNIINVTD